MERENAGQMQAVEAAVPGRGRRRRRTFLFAVLLLAALIVSPILVYDSIGGESSCFGPTHQGRLIGAVRAPLYGENYRSYCIVCALALRTYGHEDAVDALVDSFAAMAKRHPDVTFVYGEIGFPWGGSFPPHRTHQNGLSLDVMVPLRDGRSLRAHAFNRFGYDEEFNAQGVGESGEIDFEALASQLVALDQAARERGGRIARVFFAPDLQDELFRTAEGARLKATVPFNQRQSWVRHDDHYHADLAFSCR